MAIRIRSVNGLTVALCAAETDAQPGDLYLDDGMHYALAAKFCRDWQGETITWSYPDEWAAMDTQKQRDAVEELHRWLTQIAAEKFPARCALIKVLTERCKQIDGDEVRGLAMIKTREQITEDGMIAPFSRCFWGQPGCYCWDTLRHTTTSLEAVSQVPLQRGGGIGDMDDAEWQKTQAVLEAARQLRQRMHESYEGEGYWDTADVLSTCLDALDDETQREAWCLTIYTHEIPQWIGRYDTYEAMETAARTRRDHSPGQWISESGGIIHWRNREADVTILGDLARYHGPDHPCRRTYISGETTETADDMQRGTREVSGT